MKDTVIGVELPQPRAAVEDQDAVAVAPAELIGPVSAPAANSQASQSFALAYCVSLAWVCLMLPCSFLIGTSYQHPATYILRSKTVSLCITITLVLTVAAVRTYRQHWVLLIVIGAIYTTLAALVVMGGVNLATQFPGMRH